MFSMIDPAGIGLDACESESLPPAAVRCLRAAAGHEHQRASALNLRGKDARKPSLRRMGHLCAMSARFEASAADLAREAR